MPIRNDSGTASRRSYLQSIISLDDFNEEEKSIIQKLAVRAYHLPGYTFWQDWWQFFFNNHPIWGLCFHHHLHPLGFRERFVYLVGSLACGLGVTNGVIIWYYYNGLDLNRVAVAVQLNNFFADQQDQDEDGENILEVTSGMLSCWTVAGIINSVFDIFIWYITACPCCQAGGSCYQNTTCSRIGAHIAHIIVLIATTASLLAVMYRAHLEADADLAQEHFSFLEGYLISVGMNMIVYRPVMSFILFTGVLGCFRLPFLGGRPVEKRKENRYQNETETMPDYISYDEEFGPRR